MTTQNKLKVAVIGAGFSGLMALIKLREAGIDDVTIYEKADDVGGTWRDNRYPGVGCDVPSHLYRFTWEPNPEWSHVCSPGSEIFAYIKRIAAKYDTMPNIKFSSEVTKAEFVDGQWQLETVQGPQGAFDIVITAVGCLHHPVYPDIAGLDSFAGPCFHTSQWDESVSLEGKKVGIIGTGSTSTQIVSAIVDKVGKLTLFQRTAQWVLPLPNPEIPEFEKAKFRAKPSAIEAEYKKLAIDWNSHFAAMVVGENPEHYEFVKQQCRENLEQVEDPVLRAKLTPDYEVGCKRLVMSQDFYSRIQHPNAEVVTEKIERIEPSGILTVDGQLHELDVLVLATGFDAHRYVGPMNVIGRDGLKLADAWAEATHAYRAVSIAGFPNWFILGGPNSPVGNLSWLVTIELQFNYIMQLIEKLRSGNVKEITPKAEAVREFYDALNARMKDTIWTAGCNSWYLDKNGNPASWPWSYEEFEKSMQKPVLEDFEMA